MRGDGLPDDARPDHRAVVGPGAHPIDRPVVRASAAASPPRPLLSPALLLEGFWWGSVFLVTLPLSVVALVLAVLFVPSHVNESTDPVDNLGGILSVVLVGGADPLDQLRAGPEQGRLSRSAWPPSRSRRGRLRDPPAARQEPALRPRRRRRRIFWVAACAGIIVFGSLMGAMFVGQQFLQNVLGYSTFEAGPAILPAVAVHGPGRAALGQARRGPRARFTLLTGYAFLPARLPRHAPALEGGASRTGRSASPTPSSARGRVRRHARVALPHRIGARHRAGMASGTADLQRDLGGAIMQSIFGALLTAGYAAAVASAIASAPDEQQITDSVQSQLTKSFSGAEAIAEQYPQYADAITAGAEVVVPGRRQLGVHRRDHRDR